MTEQPEALRLAKVFPYLENGTPGALKMLNKKAKAGEQA